MYFKEINFQEKKFVYDFNLLTVEQAELAKEVAEFKNNQIQMHPENFRQYVKSNGADWKFIIMSFLLREMKENVVLEFNRDKAEFELENIIRQFPVVQLEVMGEIIQNFFMNMGLGNLTSELLQNNVKRNAIETLIPYLLNNQKKKEIE